MPIIKDFFQKVSQTLSPQKNYIDGTTGKIYSKAGSFTYGSSLMGRGKIDFKTFYYLYGNNNDVYSCVREWVENVGSGGWTLLNDNDPDAGVPDRDYFAIEDILNNGQSFRQTLRRTVRDLGVCDNAYWEIVRNGVNQVVGVAPLDPRTMSIVATENGEVVRYVQKISPSSEPVVFTPEQVVHFKTNPDPNNELLGFSPLEPALLEVRTDMEATTSNYAFFKNRATPASLFILDEDLSKEATDEVIKNIKEQFGGSANTGKSGAIKGLKEVKQLSMSNRDVEFLEGRRFSTEKICSAYGVPKFMLGYTESTNNNNGTELTEHFYTGTIAPKEEIIADIITRRLLRDILGLENYSFKFYEQKFNEDEKKRLALDEYRNGAITLRQYKQRVGDEVNAIDETLENLDAYIIHSGASAVKIEDVGIEPVDISDPEEAQNFLSGLSKLNEKS